MIPARRKNILWAAALVLGFAGGGLFAQEPLVNASSVTLTTSGVLWDSPSIQLSVRFTAQWSGAVTQLYLRGHESLFSGFSPTFSAQVYTDTGGVPGTPLGMASSFTLEPGVWSVVSISPVSLTAGQVYHLILDYLTGPLDPNNHRTLMTTEPKHPFYPWNQTPDSQLALLVSTDNGSSYLLQEKMPVFLMEFDTGDVQGNPYYLQTADALHGGGSFPTASSTDDPVVGEEFLLSGAGGSTVFYGVKVFASRAATSLFPRDDLMVVLEDVAAGTVLASGPAVFANSLKDAPQWFSAPFSEPVTLTTLQNYRLSFRSPAGSLFQPITVFSAGVTELSGVSVQSGFLGAQGYKVTSSAGGALYTNHAGEDINAGLTSTPLSWPVPPSVPLGSWYGNQAVITSVAQGELVDAPSEKISLRFTAQEGKAVSLVYVDLAVTGTPGQVKLSLAADSGGAPGAVLESVIFTPVDGVQAVTFTTMPILTGGQVYHLLIEPQGSVDNLNNIKVEGTAPVHGFIPSHEVFDGASGFFHFDGAKWTAKNIQPVYVIAYVDGTLEGNPYTNWNIGPVHGNGTKGDFSDDWVAAHQWNYSKPTRVFNRVEVYLLKTGTPPDVFYQILDLSPGSEQILDSGLLLESGNFVGGGWYGVNLKRPVTFVTGRTYRLQLYASEGDASNHWLWYAPEVSSTVLNSARFEQTDSTAASSFQGKAGNFTLSSIADRSFRFQVAGSGTPTPTATPPSTPTPTMSSTPTPTFTPPLTATPTLTPTGTFTPTPTNTIVLPATPTAAWTPPPDVGEKPILNRNVFNPFRESLVLTFRLTRSENVRIMVFNVAGEEVRSLFRENVPAGTYQVKWDGKNNSGTIVGNAVYFIIFEAGGRREILKTVVLK